MGRNGLKVGVVIRKFVILPAKICYRSVYNHPFLVGILLLLVVLYRSSPFLFVKLVSASPVLVCTAVLLGTLLSFGEPNIPLIEKDEEILSENAPLKTGRLENLTVVERDESFDWSSGYRELKREAVEKINDEEPLLDMTHRVGVLDDDAQNSMPFDRNSREIGFEKQWVDGKKSEFENLGIEQSLNLEDQKVRMGIEVSSTHDEDLENRVSLEDYISAEGSIDAQLRDQLESSLGSWKPLDKVFEGMLSHFQAERFEDYKSANGSLNAQTTDQLESSFGEWKQLDPNQSADDESDSESDGAESSSPDASMADIIPMLDELDPLLEYENPQASNLSRQNSKSCESSIHSDDESDEKEGEEEVGDVKSDVDDDYEEEMQGNKEESSQSAIKWTEDDQKNLMDLGTSELERNQRLESLIARRRARRNLRMMTERNLIDLDGMDLSFQVPLISTRRQNPFDISHDSYDNLGLPPIPGSAPSVMLSRQNPFDLPYDSSEEKPDLMGDSFQQEFMELNQRETSNQKEALFRRNETFNIGSSIFDFGRRASRFSPYFVPERTDSDGMNYSSSFVRQSSGLSESKVSTVAETELSSLDGDQEEKKLTELELAQEMESGSENDHASEHVELETAGELLLDNEDEKKDLVLGVPEIELGGSHTSVTGQLQEMESGSENDHASDHVELGSQLSEDRELLSDNDGDEKKNFVLGVPEIELGGPHASETGQIAEINLVDWENHPEEETWMSARENSTNNIHSIIESIEEKHSTSSSSTSSPKEYNDVKVEDLDKDLVDREENIVNNVDKTDIPSERSLEASNFSHTTEVDDYHPKEPVYDSSPHAVQKNHSSSSISSDAHIETLEANLCNLSIVQRDLFVGEESKSHSENAEKNALVRKQDSDLFNEKVSPYEGERALTQEDYEGVHLERKMDDEGSVANLPSADEFKSSGDFILAQEKGEIDVSDDCVSLVHSELSGLKAESSSNMKNHDNDVHENLLSTLDEGYFLPHDFVTHDPCDDPKEQEPSNIHTKLEEVGHSNSVDETLAAIMPHEPQDDVLYDPFHTDEYSSQPEGFEKKPVEVFSDEDHVISEAEFPYTTSEDDHIFKGLLRSTADGKILEEETSDIKDIDEGLLSELDAVGDFSVENTGPHEHVLGEMHSSTEMPVATETLLDDNIYVEKSELLREITEPGFAGFEGSNLDSLTGDHSTGLLVLEARSMEDIEVAFKKASEGEVQKSVISDTQVELIREEEESNLDSLTEDHSTELLALEARSMEDLEASFNKVNVGDVQKSVISDARDELTREEEESNLDSHTGDHSSGLLVVEARSMEEIEGVFKKVNEGEVQKSVIADARIELRREKEESNLDSLTEVHSTSLPVLEAQYMENLEASFEKVSEVEVQKSTRDELIREEEESNLDSHTGDDRTGLVVLEARSMEEIEGVFKKANEGEVQKSAISDARVELTSEEEESNLDSHTRDHSTALSMEDEGDVQKSVVNDSVLDELTREGVEAPYPETESLPEDTERGAHATEVISLKDDVILNNRDSVLELLESDLSPVEGHNPGGEDFEEVVKTEIHESNIVDEIQESSPVIEASIVPADESRDQIQKVGFMESKSLPIASDIEEVREFPVVLESEDQKESVANVESELLLIDRDIKEVQELSVVESEDQIEKVGSMKTESLLIIKDIKDIQESPVVEPSIEPVVESKNQLERYFSSASELWPIDPVVEPEDQIELSQHTEVLEDQALRDLQSGFPQQSEVVPNPDDLEVDSSTAVIESNRDEFGGQCSSESAIGKSSLQGEEGKSYESHLKSSSSSSSISHSSSSSSDSDEE